MLRLASLASVALALGASSLAAPRLVVVISVDQLRGDYPARFEQHFLPARSGATLGGFQWLKERGAWYTDAHYIHVPTATGPGHATILSGSVPALHGIVENDWFSREAGKPVYCVEDPTVKTVGGPSAPMSPRTLLVSTVGDELKMATNGRAKVVGIAIKDRAAILMAGHAADTVIWFDGGNGSWVTSTFYASTLPNWVQDINKQGRPEKELSTVWTPLLPDKAYEFTRAAPFVKFDPLATPVFSHPNAGSGSGKFRNWTTSPQGQQFVFDTVAKAVDAESLGQDDVPDLLCINLSTNDYIGHAYGPNSPEVMDITVRTDRALSSLLNLLNKKVPGGMNNVTVVLTADHGVLPIVEEMRDTYRMTSMRISGADVTAAVNKALSAKYGEATWALNFSAPHLYLNDAQIREKGLNAGEVRALAAQAVASVPGIYRAIPREQILEGRLPNLPWATRVTNGFLASRAGDVVVLENPGNYFGAGTGTGHGSAWTYDHHVPILLGGYGIKSVVSGRTVATADIASTLCQLLGIEQPSGNVGAPLREAIGR